jgi:hypothetical protein
VAADDLDLTQTIMLTLEGLQTSGASLSFVCAHAVSIRSRGNPCWTAVFGKRAGKVDMAGVGPLWLLSDAFARATFLVPP